MPICYLDRDGVFNHHIPYVGTIERFIWHDEIIEIIKVLNSLNYNLILVTNQSGIKRKYYSMIDFFNVSYHLINRLNKHNLDIEIRFCPHLPQDNCLCRKPNTGMISNDLRTTQDIFIGDQESDMECAFRSGVNHRWLINPKKNSKLATRQANNHKDLHNYLIAWYKEDIFKEYQS